VTDDRHITVRDLERIEDRLIAEVERGFTQVRHAVQTVDERLSTEIADLRRQFSQHTEKLAALETALSGHITAHITKTPDDRTRPLLTVRDGHLIRWVLLTVLSILGYLTSIGLLNVWSPK
jgi:hypothetical protein